MDGKLQQLRDAGWMVAVHNDYRFAGEFRTFWLLTHANGKYVKGEAATDQEAIAQCAALADAEQAIQSFRSSQRDSSKHSEERRPKT